MEHTRTLAIARFKFLGVFVGILFLQFAVQGCVLGDRSFSQPTIIPIPGWSMTQKCGYEGCAVKVDFLVGQDVTIRIEADNDIPHAIQNRIFLIQIKFLSGTPRIFEYDPSQTTVQLPNGQIAKAKGLPCPGTIMDRAYMLAAPPIVGFQRIDKIDCFRLFFDVAPPPVDEVFTLNLVDLRRGGMRVDITEIVFRPGKR